MRTKLVYATGFMLLLAGCHVDAHKNGDTKDVNIETPFGGLQVRTNQPSVMEQIGLDLYPGAQPLKKHNEDGSADVDMNFGSFRMRVKAANYHTDDPPAKVEAFYREQLKRYGDVIECRNNQPVGQPARTFEGLTCESQRHSHVSVDDRTGNGQYQLKAGSPEHQHIVALSPKGAGTDMGLVVLDLPRQVAGED